MDKKIKIYEEKAQTIKQMRKNRRQLYKHNIALEKLRKSDRNYLLYLDVEVEVEYSKNKKYKRTLTLNSIVEKGTTEFNW